MTSATTSPPIDRGTDSATVTASVPLWALLTVGVVFVLLSGHRWNVAPLAWIGTVPFLLYARRVTRWTQWLGLGAILTLAVTVQVLKIITEPVSIALAPMFSIPAAIGLLVLLAATEWVRRRLGETVAVLSFASLAALADIAGYRTTEFGAWTASASTQVSSVLVLQLASLVGLWGIGFLIGWVNALVAAFLGSPRPRALFTHALILGVVILASLTWATLRTTQTQTGELLVGAITTDVGITGDGMPSAEVISSNTDSLFDRSAEAADRGAKLVVWPEGATFVSRAEEPLLLRRGQDFSREHRVDLVLAYAVVLSDSPRFFDNRLAFIDSDGAIADTYRKHHPVPGEPAMKGTDELRVVQRPYGRVGFAICYDYDFPAMAREHARLGANLVVVPSSDWRGIDPVHTEMARVRGIEGGFSVVRPVRWSTSAAFDAYGRVRGLLPAQEDSKVLVANVPLERVPTVYARVGDAPAALLVVFLAGVLARGLRRRQTRREDGLSSESESPHQPEVFRSGP